MGSYALAIDIGASGGRHILGRIEGDHIVLQEIARFPNEMCTHGRHRCWDRDALYGYILEGLRACAAQGAAPATVGIDTWGVDYTLLDAQGKPVGDSVAYRDARTEGMPEKLDGLLDPAALYAATGIARQSYNTLYQLMAEQGFPPAIASADRLLFTPCYLSYCLTGIACNETTMASTSGLLNANTQDWDPAVLRAAGIPADLLRAPLCPPGTRVGAILPGIAQAVGFSCEVVLPASHDTASAYLATPTSGGNPAILSSGTWSLLGMELDAPVLTEEARLHGFTNEIGFGGKITLLRNIIGLWILQALRREAAGCPSYAEMAELASQGEAYTPIFDAADERFLAPDSMNREILAALCEKGEPLPANESELYYCVHHSLAQCYGDAIAHLTTLTGKSVTAVHVVGGGCQNRMLNQLTADATGLPVYAGPKEATALGNLAAQWIATGELSDMQAARRLIGQCASQEVFRPR